MDTKKIEKAVSQIEAAKQTLERELAQAQSQNQKAKPVAISPRTKLPVTDPESQAVERIHYEMQTSLCGRPPTAEELAELERKKE